jgi:hypothetical protein
MTINRLTSAGFALAVLLSGATAPAWADRESRDDGYRGGGEAGVRDDDRRGSQPPNQQRDGDRPGGGVDAGPGTRDDDRRGSRPPERRHDGNRQGGGISAGPGTRDDDRRGNRPPERRRDGDRRGDADTRPPPGYIHDRRHRHDRHYPPRGHVVRRLPHGHRHIHYHGVHYYFYGGVWYQPYGPSFIVVMPPIGLVVPILPPYYTTLWVGGYPYYYAGGVYYTWQPDTAAYVVVEPPPESEVREDLLIADQLYVYPKKGQSEQQQSIDRYQCHSWAVKQTGFDPTQPDGGVAASQHTGKRADYQRAMKACLEGRGYSVR